MTMTTGNALASTSAPTAPAIAATGLSAGYTALPVIHDIDLHVNQGEVVALLGPNGAGKTTLLLALSGELPLMSGKVEMSGKLTKAALHQRARNGMSFVTEERSIFKSLSTMDNLKLSDCDPDQALAIFPELRTRLDVMAGLLSGGEQQMLTTARAIARGPRILLADEVSLGLAPLTAGRLIDQLRTAARTIGTGVLLVEQQVRRALDVADRAYVLNRGRIALSGSAAELRSNLAEIEDSYLTARVEP
jgi:branched-chain amino acid transport system ATP-binding protein